MFPILTHRIRDDRLVVPPWIQASCSCFVLPELAEYSSLFGYIAYPTPVTWGNGAGYLPKRVFSIAPHKSIHHAAYIPDSHQPPALWDTVLRTTYFCSQDFLVLKFYNLIIAQTQPFVNRFLQIFCIFIHLLNQKSLKGRSFGVLMGNGRDCHCISDVNKL